MVATSLLWCDSMDYVIIISSRDTVGDTTPYFLMYDSCFIPSAHVLSLILLSLLSVSNIKYASSSNPTF